MVLRRSPRNPILTRAAIPDLPPEIVDATSVFNPGAVKLGETYWLLLRVQTRGRRTFLLMARSADGEAFEVLPQIVRLSGIERLASPVHHVYDPRITWLEGVGYITLALDTDDGCRVGLARTADLAGFDFLGIVSTDDARNAVLFPERVAGRYLRLERPNRVTRTGAAGTGDEIWLAASDDLLGWEALAPVLRGRWHYWDELIGSGPPPVKTREGWLCVYHGVAQHLASAQIYQAGVCLLDLEDPRILRARGRDNILEPRELYEIVGQVPNVVFPTGLIVEATDDEGFARPDSVVRLYYGAADSCVALATTTIGELLAACDA